MIKDLISKTAVRCPGEFMAMAHYGGQVLAHRLIVAKILNRSLTKREEVHHINGNEKDHRPENLMLFATHKDHIQYEWNIDTSPVWDGRDGIE